MHTGSDIYTTSSQSLEQQPITQWWDVQESYNIRCYSLQSAWVLRQILLSNYLLFDLKHSGSKSRWNDLLNLLCESLQLIVLSAAGLGGMMTEEEEQTGNVGSATVFPTDGCKSDLPGWRIKTAQSGERSKSNSEWDFSVEGLFYTFRKYTGSTDKKLAFLF